ncbi:hypothetical protein HOLleu_40027 [Holothuria leucospilota]|uniref:NACHT domain-containing protein n=1 Tax=Holothuria leucospilota TaxID=206669 RepID=A0A9Q0YEP5_HOLLE|nr:hypothetical protein HOLleu_40027 [Holothuria leucospilota]
MANTVLYAFDDFKRDLSVLVDESYRDRLTELVKITGARLEGASSNPSPTGTLLDILTSQGVINKDNISVLVSAFEEANMTKATELSVTYKAGLPTAHMKPVLARRCSEQLKETYQKICNDPSTTGTSSSGVPISSLPALTLTTDGAGDGALFSRHDIFKRLHPEHPYLVLIGGTGSGKSTLCHRLLLDWINKDERSYLCDVEIIIFTSLSHVNLRASLAESIRDSLLPPDTTLCDEDIEDIIVSHLDSLLFIFDSLDDLNITELTLDHHSKRLEIGKILAGHQIPFIPKLVTSSQSLTSDHPCHGIEYFLCRIQRPQIKDYVTKYFSTEPKIGANVFHHISKSSITSDFCEIPLLLRIVCDIAKRPNSIRIGEVLHVHVFVSFVVQNTFEKYCFVNGIKQMDFVQFSRVLGHLALETLLQKQRVDIKTKRILAEDEKPMIGLGMKAGFIKEVQVVGRDSGGSASSLTFVRFKNRLLQQFFAAARLTEVSENSPKVFNQILDAVTHDPSFHYLLLFICGNSALCCRSILNKINGVEIHRTSAAEYLYECQEADGDDSHLMSLFRWLSFRIVISGNMSKYKQRATFSLIQRMRNAKVSRFFITSHNFVNIAKKRKKMIRNTSL